MSSLVKHTLLQIPICKTQPMSVIDVNRESILPNNTAVCRYNIYLVIKRIYMCNTCTHGRTCTSTWSNAITGAFR